MKGLSIDLIIINRLKNKKLFSPSCPAIAETRYTLETVNTSNDFDQLQNPVTLCALL